MFIENNFNLIEIGNITRLYQCVPLHTCASILLIVKWNIGLIQSVCPRPGKASP